MSTAVPNNPDAESRSSSENRADVAAQSEALAALNALEVDGAEPGVSWESLIEEHAAATQDANDENAEPAEDAVDPAVGVQSDSLAASVILLMALSCIQPLVAFGRGIIFCRWLDPDQLGAWDMALSFLTLAAPVVVFGIPGSFGRYVQHYLQRGQLGSFLRRTSAVCAVLSVVAIGLLIALPNQFAVVVFGDATFARLVPAVAICLATMIGFGFVIELLTALRLFRVVSCLQFVKGFGFALFGATLLWSWRVGPESIVVAYTLACGVVVLFGGWRVLREMRRLPRDPARVSHSSLWSKLMPFAIWIWVTNALDNLYMVVDRYMILHYSGLPNAEALAEVGNYHSSRIVPMLFVSFAGMLASLVMPHLSHDWEAGHRARVGARVTLAIKLISLALAAGSMAVLIVAPWLFAVGFEGKYDGGLAVLPWVLTFCAWFGITYVAEMYLWCAERVKLGSLAMFCGLAINVVLNLLLLPSFGLLGAVLATAFSRLIVLAILYAFAVHLGMRFRWSLCLLTLVPLCVVLGPWTGSLVLAAVFATILGTHQLISLREKATLIRTARGARLAVMQKLGRA